jgi:hypothetical protein
MNSKWKRSKPLKLLEESIGEIPQDVSIYKSDLDSSSSEIIGSIGIEPN